jgi:hypothetical protein
LETALWLDASTLMPAAPMNTIPTQFAGDSQSMWLTRIGSAPLSDYGWDRAEAIGDGGSPLYGHDPTRPPLDRAVG